MNNILGDNIGSVELIQHIGDDIGIIRSARVSYGGDTTEFGDKEFKLLKYLLNNKHESPFEHNSMTFRVKAPIYIIRQWMRHRVGVSYNEISARYTEVKNEFYIPSDFRKQAKDNKQMSTSDTVELMNGMDFSSDIAVNVDGRGLVRIQEVLENTIEQNLLVYHEMIKAGVSREQARGILPTCIYSEFYFTCNLRSLLHFIGLRSHSHAQWEIQQYSNAMRAIATTIFPYTFKALEELK
jgi:thymidylate synthase (FAD)